jgi:hypothetical protein
VLIPLLIPRLVWEDNIKMYINDIACGLAKIETDVGGIFL